MIRLMVVHGAGMELRGKVDVEIFGPMTMDDYSAAIRRDADALGVAVEVVHTLDAAELCAILARRAADGIDGVIINPAGFTVGHPAIADAIRATGVPSVEVHVSNPAARGVASSIAPGTTCVVAGFGVGGYRLAMQGLVALIAARGDGG
ncbi:MAG: type II 3-dehydroquinate dehydratase [Lautropia sp.]